MKTNLLRINLTAQDTTLHQGHLKMGGVNPRGLEINVNSRYLTLGGQPWLPVMGEFHFSRYPVESWRDELLKMKSGGITVIASYIFWIHHEEIKGQVDWTGSQNLRHFIELCGKCGLFFFARIGPWCHGECRNGGFPDWLLEQCNDQVRRNDPKYLSYVKEWYEEIAAQMRGLLWKDGGPVIGLQVENELTDQPEHLATLKQMARKAGLDVPLYTMTGWGPAQVPPGGELIPVFGGYPDACWDRHIDDWARECRINYFFNLLRDDNAIGTDILVARPGGRIVDLDRYPFGACELGGGMQVTYHRRAHITTDDVAALAMVKVGSGNNLQGYYMYHGGLHPRGQNTTMQESQATGYWNDYPIVSYDFQAPLSEFGQVRDSYHALRLLHQFLADFGSQLAPLPAALPEHSPHAVDDLQTLRWVARSDGKSGFIFINNYQRMEPLPGHEAVQFDLQLSGGHLCIPSKPVKIPGGMYGIWPFNFDMEDIRLTYATAQPFCRIVDPAAPCYVFSTCRGVDPELVFDPATFASIEDVAAVGNIAHPSLADGIASFRVRDRHGKPVRVLVLDETRVRQCWKATVHGRERLFISPSNLVFDGDTLILRSRNTQDLWFEAFSDQGTRPVFRRYNFPLPEQSIQPESIKLRDAAPPREVQIGSQGVATPPDESAFEEAETWQVDIPAEAFHGTDELYLVVEYQGDIARAYEGGTLIADDFYNGRAWEIGLRRFRSQGQNVNLTLKVLPLHPQAPVYIEPKFRFSPLPALVRQIHLVPEYRQTVDLASLEI